MNPFDHPNSGRRIRYLRREAPMWGDAAAEYGWKIEQIKLAVPLVLLLGALGFVINSLIPILLALLVAVPSSIAIMWNQTRRNAAASEALGVPVNWKSGPRRRGVEGYREWCAEAGVIPFAASNKFGPGQPPDGK
jgi:hypothetical protein